MLIRDNSVNKYLSLFYCFLLVVLMFRVFSNFILNAPLHFDEAQYWTWSRTIQWGYYSKPPLIAWLIKLNAGLCGNQESCLRLFSPLMHSITAGVIFYTSYYLSKDIKTGIFSALLYLLMPGVTYSSFFISTDVPLLMFASITGLLIIKMMESESKDILSFIFLALCLSMGILSKYAMFFFLISILISSLFSEKIKRLILSLKFFILFLLVIILISPHIFWNLKNNLVTFSHTFDNANTDNLKFNFFEPIFFIVSQFGIFGVFPLLLVFLEINSFSKIKELDEIQKILIIWFIFPILLITILALFSRANANWAIVGYPFGCVFLGTLVFKRNPVRVQSLSIFSQFFLTSIFLFFLLFENPIFNPLLKWSYAVSLSKEISEELKKGENFGFIADDREDYAHMLYYLRDLKIPMAKWNGDKKIDDHFELTTNTNNLSGLDVIFLTRTYPTPIMEKTSTRIIKLKSLEYTISNKKREYNIFLIRNWNSKK